MSGLDPVGIGADHVLHRPHRVWAARPYHGGFPDVHGALFAPCNIRPATGRPVTRVAEVAVPLGGPIPDTCKGAGPHPRFHSRRSSNWNVKAFQPHPTAQQTKPSEARRRMKKRCRAGSATFLQGSRCQGRMTSQRIRFALHHAGLTPITAPAIRERGGHRKACLQAPVPSTLLSD